MARKKYLIVGVVALAVGAGGVGLAQRSWESGTLPPQPIAFNHKLHLTRVQGITCKDCHQFVMTEAYAGLPSKYVCFECHDPTADKGDATADANKPAFADLMAFAEHPGDIPWHRVTAFHDDVFFSHRRHVVVAGLDCRECHGDIPDRTSPPTRGPIVMSMDTCIACHAARGASTDCVSCHR